jgi:geranylgeranyl pyrophosphate synthase
MKDDLLDVTADERSLGKPAANDLVERKTTIPVIAALASGNGDFRAQMRSFYEEGGNDAIPSVVLGIEREGGLRATRSQIALFVERAKQALEPIAPSPAKRELAQLTDALLY